MLSDFLGLYHLKAGSEVVLLEISLEEYRVIGIIFPNSRIIREIVKDSGEGMSLHPSSEVSRFSKAFPDKMTTHVARMNSAHPCPIEGILSTGFRTISSLWKKNNSQPRIDYTFALSHIYEKATNSVHWIPTYTLLLS